MLTDHSDGGIGSESLEHFVQQLFVHADAPEESAKQVAHSLVTADIRGHNSHGSRRTPSYVSFMRDELDDKYHIDAHAQPTIEDEGPVHATIDGQFAFGQVVGRTAVDTAIEKATENGLAMVGVRDATHLGRIGEWSERATEAGLIFMAFAGNQGGGHVAPPGSAERRFGTNPLSFGVPTFDALDFPIVLDMATTQVAAGKIKETTKKQDESIPEEWTVTDSGKPLSNATEYMDGEGALLPLGGNTAGYKGFGLSMITELFATIVGDGLITPQTEYQRGNAAMFVAADPTLFTTREEVKAKVSALSEYLRETNYQSHLQTGETAYGDQALLPGEAEYIVSEERRANGIPIPDDEVLALCELAIELGIENQIPQAFKSRISMQE